MVVFRYVYFHSLPLFLSKDDEMNKRSLISFRFLNATIYALREYLNAARVFVGSALTIALYVNNSQLTTVGVKTYY